MRRRVVGLALLTAGAVLASCDSASAPVPGFPLTSSVLIALREARPYALRFDGDERHTPCAPQDTTTLLPSPLCAALPSTVSRSLGRLAPGVADAMRAGASADALWASALLDLAAPPLDARRADRVIARLREVDAREPTQSLVSNHLAIAYLVRATVREDARDLFAALDYAEQSVARDSVSPALRFNRAILHGLLGTPLRAREEWGVVAAHETVTAWRDEGAGRERVLPAAHTDAFDRVSPEAIARDPQGARDFALDSVLLRWARSAVSRDSLAARASLAELRMVAAGLLALRGDSSIDHVANEVATFRPADDVITAIRGIQAYRRTQYDSSVVLLAPTVLRLRSAGATAIADWAQLMLGGARLMQRHYAQALQLLEPIATRAERRGDRALRARTLWASALLVGRDGRLDDAERRYAEAREIFLAIGEWRNAAKMATGAADTQRLLGRSLEAANSAFLGFTENVRNLALTQEEELLFVADQLRNEGRSHAAAHLLSEAVLVSSSSERVKDLPETLARLAPVQLSLGRGAAATASLSRARTLARLVSDTAMRSRLDAELDRAEVSLVSERDPSRAIALVNAARRHFASTPLDDAPLLNTRARLALRVGDSAAAAADLAESIRLARSQSAAPTPEQARQLAATLRDAQRTLIEIALARGDSASAYEETVRLPSIEGRDDARQRAADVVPGDGVAELRFVVLPQSVLSWVRTSRERRLTRTHMTREALAATLSRFIGLVRSGTDTAAARALGRDLYDALVAPHAALLAGVESVDVYPDDVLTDLPLAALWDHEGRPLGERLAIHFVVSTARQAATRGNSVSSVPLLIGNPTWLRSEHPGLEPLRWADEEVRQVATQYPVVELLTGAEATKRAVLQSLPRHAVIHFAGHSRVNLERPAASHLVLAAGPTFSDGVLTAAEIARLDLRGVKLVVLSSCGRSRDDAASLGQANALVVAFLDAGVESVVASPYEVIDGSTLNLFTAFHDASRTRADAGEALRETFVANAASAARFSMGPMTMFQLQLFTRENTGRRNNGDR